ncbi:hypothetical protein BDY24DRAFT_241290 [Mrakia frigida]|uniref:uncharacterized protein n=1 Tax=Mrakia frigida TaxID=29902 RepID=UPI003FCC24EB
MKRRGPRFRATEVSWTRHRGKENEFGRVDDMATHEGLKICSRRPVPGVLEGEERGKPRSKRRSDASDFRKLNALSRTSSSRGCGRRLILIPCSPETLQDGNKTFVGFC